jgi:mono/diheme cytochrome c family protein
MAMADARAEGRRRNPMKRIIPWTLLVAAVLLGTWSRPWGQTAGAVVPDAPAASASPSEDVTASRAAFLAAYTVLMHPRCMNCHPAGDAPLQGDDSHVHAQNVQRGPDGKGKYALKCANCHQLANLAGANMPPGNPNWHLPPPEMKMVFQGKTPRELARQLKDPAQNGHKTLDQILHHVAEDKLVLGGWDPGDGRTRPPLTHDEFVRKMREWIEKGAAEPM